MPTLIRKFWPLILLSISIPVMAQGRIPQINIQGSNPNGNACSPANILSQFGGDIYTCDPNTLKWRILGGSSGTYISPSGDQTGAIDTAAIQAVITAHNTVQLGTGNYYITGLTWSAASDFYCSNLGNTFIYMTSPTNSILTVNYGGGMPNNESLGMIIRGCNFFYKVGVTPVAGDVLNIAGVDGTHNLSGVHFEDNRVYGAWGGIRTGNYMVNNWFDGNFFDSLIVTSGTATVSGTSVTSAGQFSTAWPANTMITLNGSRCVIASVASSSALTLATACGSTGTFTISDGCFVVNTPAPYGDSYFLGNQCTGTTGTPGLTIHTSDAFMFGHNKLNGSNVTFTRAGPTKNISVQGNSIEGLAGQPCAVDFGPTGSNAPLGVSFSGGGMGIYNYLFCDGATVSGTTDAFFTVDPTMLEYPNIGFGMLAPTNNSNSVLQYYNQANFNQIVKFNGQGVFQGGTSSVPAINIPSINTQSASSDFSTILIDGTTGGTTSGTAAIAGIGFRSKATGTQQDWILLGGSGAPNNNFRFLDNGNAGSGGGGDAMDFLPGAYVETFKPPLYTTQTQVTAAATIAPTAVAFHLTGATPVATITPLTGCTTSGTACVLYIVPDSAFTLTTTGGNIGKNSTAVVGQLMTLLYDPTPAKWYPSY